MLLGDTVTGGVCYTPKKFTWFTRPFSLVRRWVLGTRLPSTVLTPSNSFSPSLKTQTFFLAFPPLVGFAEPAFLEGCFPFCCVFPFCCCLGGCRRKIKYSSYLQIFKIEPKIIAQSHNKRIISLLRVLNIPTILFCEAEETRAHYACAVERHLSNQTSD